MVHDEVHGPERFDEAGVAAAADDFRAHHGQIHDARHAGEVLEEHARGQVGDFLGAVRAGLPAGEGLDVFPPVGGVGLVAQGGFEQDAHDVGQLRQRRAAQGFQRRQIVVGHGLAGVREGLQGRKGFAHDAPIDKKISRKNTDWRRRGQSQKTGPPGWGAGLLRLEGRAASPRAPGRESQNPMTNFQRPGDGDRKSVFTRRHGGHGGFVVAGRACPP